MATGTASCMPMASANATALATYISPAAPTVVAAGPFTGAAGMLSGIGLGRVALAGVAAGVILLA